MTDPLTFTPSLEQQAADGNSPPELLQALARESIDLARLVANNPCAAPELLRELGKSSDVITRRHVAANPNTPTQVLLELGGEFPEELLNNLIFPLLLLEKPNLVEDIPLTTLRNLLKYEQVPLSFLEWGTKLSHRDVHLAVAMNVRTPRAALEKLVGSFDSQVQDAAQLHVNWAGEMNSGWDEAAREKISSFVLDENDEKDLTQLAGMGLIPEYVIEGLLKNQKNRHRVLEAIARHPNAPLGILKQLAADQHDKLRAIVAQNPNTPSNILERLAGDENVNIRTEVARHPNTPSRILQELATDKYYEMSEAIAGNPGTPVRILEKLARDDRAEVRSAVAGNPRTPVKILEKLSRDKSSWIRSMVAGNPNIPKKILFFLVKDEEPSIRSAIARNSRTPGIVLTMLAEDGVEVRLSVALNPNTPVSALEHLAHDKTFEVRLSVAVNPNTPASLFEQLLKSSDRQIDFAGYLAHHPEALPMVLKHYAKHAVSSLSRFILFLHPQIPAVTLAENNRSSSWLERYAIAQHPNTPLDALHTLAEDANRIVRAAAKANARKPQPKTITPTALTHCISAIG